MTALSDVQFLYANLISPLVNLRGISLSVFYCPCSFMIHDYSLNLYESCIDPLNLICVIFYMGKNN